MHISRLSIAVGPLSKLLVSGLLVLGCRKASFTDDERAAWERYMRDECACTKAEPPVIDCKAKMPDLARPIHTYSDADQAFQRKLSEVGRKCMQERMQRFTEEHAEKDAGPPDLSWLKDLKPSGSATAGSAVEQPDAAAPSQQKAGTASPTPASAKAATSTGPQGLPNDVVQRVVRQNFGRLRLCYENGLRTDPNAAGKIVVQFVVGAEGKVSEAHSEKSSLPDGITQCVVRAFKTFSFPPASRTTTVAYPVTFSPGD